MLNDNSCQETFSHYWNDFLGEIYGLMDAQKYVFCRKDRAAGLEQQPEPWNKLFTTTYLPPSVLVRLGASPTTGNLST